MFLVSMLIIVSPMQIPSISDEAATKVYVWGEVKQPGVYNLISSPDIVELISTAGGPTSSADLTRVKVIRGVKSTAMKINLKKAMGKGDVFFLMPGDVVVVPASFWAKAGSVVQVMTTLAVFVNLYISIRTYTGK